MIERLLEAGGKGLVAGLIGVIGYMVYYIIKKITDKK